MLEKEPDKKEQISRVMTAQQVADYLGISYNTIKNMRQPSYDPGFEGQPFLPYIRLGKCIRYLKTDVEAWLDSLPRYKCVDEYPKQQEKK